MSDAVANSAAIPRRLTAVAPFLLALTHHGTAAAWSRRNGNSALSSALMNPATARLEQSSATANPRTLAAALAAISHQCGGYRHSDVFALALGNPFLICSVPSEPDITLWPMYARDAFLVDAGRRFGMIIRPLHPPRAALGLRDSPEFFQHFDASYRPLIMRALEHDQPVLAWRGWPGELELCWGIIRGTCATPTGFTGAIYGMRGDRRPLETKLSAAPVQFYVVESSRPEVPRSEALLHHLFNVTRIALTDGLAERFAIRTGPAAYEEVCRASPSATPKQILEFANACMFEVDAAKRLLSKIAPIPPPEMENATIALQDYCHDLSACFWGAMGKPSPPTPIDQWISRAASIATAARDAIVAASV